MNNKQSQHNNYILTFIIILLVFIISFNITAYNTIKKQLEIIELNQNDIVSFNDEHFSTIENQIDVINTENQ